MRGTRTFSGHRDAGHGADEDAGDFIGWIGWIAETSGHKAS
ncbi:hypothetical protein [Streptomyces sp. JHA26]|nr:hypothetical protein [Streptomyces sp. JHA26]